MPRKASARLDDVARSAGVSLSTASRAISEPGLVHPDTRERVQRAVAMLGYVPHGAARALASRRSRTLGAVVPTLDNPIFASSTQALQRTLAAAGYTLLLASHEYDPEAELAVTRALVERGVDGLVLVGSDHSPELARFLAQSNVPFELTWTLDPAGHHHCVGFSNRLASIRMAQHLLDLGHREIAVLSGYTANNDRARERVAGVREALAGRGIPLPEARVVETAFSVARGRAALRALLEQDPKLTAVICGNDILALGALLECAARGLAVPADFSVAGFDDIELAAEVSPALTTVRIPTARIGQRAGERLLARLAGKRVAKAEEVPVELMLRASTGPVPAGAARRGAKRAPVNPVRTAARKSRR